MRPETISQHKKQRFLLSMSEAEFLRKVVRPLFVRQGLEEATNVKTPTGIVPFFAADKLGINDLYVASARKGSLTMSGKAAEGISQALKVLKDALSIVFRDLNQHARQFPAKVFLCSSGHVNGNARQHILQQVNDPRVVLLDAGDLIPRIDTTFAELWLEIDAELFPYLRAIKKAVEMVSEQMAFSDVVAGDSVPDAATDHMFVPLRLHRTYLKPVKADGQMRQILRFEELPVTGVVNRRERLVLILGEAGSGKSTSIKRLAYVLADRGIAGDSLPRIPVLLRATDVWNRKHQPFVQILSDTTAQVNDSKKPAFTSEDLRAGRVVVLLDALDELPDDCARREVVSLILQFHKDNPLCQHIVTSRDYSFVKNTEELSGFTQFRLSPINYKQAELILHRFEKNKNLPSEKAKEILRRIQEVHGMELNPLLVTVFAATSDYSRKDIPANITELFKKYTEMMLGRWDATKGLSQQYHAPLKDFLLQKIAYEMHRQHLTSIPVAEFRAAVEMELANRGHQADTQQLLNEILYRSDLVRVIGESAEFRHHLIQEFFAGRGIPSKELLHTYVSDEWWQRAVVFYFGQNPGDGESFKLIIDSLGPRPAKEMCAAAMTVGLALQASYLVKVDEKLKVFPWVVTGLSNALPQAAPNTGNDDFSSRFPLSHFIGYYLWGRDSVACNFLARNFHEIANRLFTKTLSTSEKDVRTFWLIVGLMETGEIARAQELVRKFYPSDPRLLLAIQLGCFMIEHLRIADKAERKNASEMSKSLEEYVSPLKGKLLQEFKSQLLEIRKGTIHALDAPKADQEPESRTDIKTKTASRATT